MRNFIPTTILIFSIAQSLFADGRTDGFIRNDGQLVNVCNEPVEHVKFLWGSSHGYNIQFKEDGFSYDTYQKIAGSSVYELHRLDIQFLNKTHASVLRGTDQKEEFLNYHSDNQSFEKIPVYDQLRYTDIYQGIDLIAQTNEKTGRFKYDFILDQHADVSDIKIAYKGYDEFSIDNNQISFNLSGRIVSEYIPKSWILASGEAIDVEYKILEESDEILIIGFEVCDNSLSSSSLVIDPEAVVEWATYHGDSLADIAEAMVTDSLGNIFIAGTTNSLQFIASDSSYQSVYSGGDSDAYLLKMNQHGLRHWSTYYGGSGADRGLGICVDEYDYIYLTGSTTSTDSIGSEGQSQDSPSGGVEGFVAKFNRLGEFIWDTYIGGAEDDFVTDCFVFKKQKLYIGGYTYSSDLLENFGLTPANSHAGNSDLFTLTLSPDGTVIDGNYFGGSEHETMVSLKADTLGNLAICANTNGSTGLAFNSPYQSQPSGGMDGYFFSTDSAYTTLWSSYFGTENNDFLTDIAISDDGIFFYLSGYTDGEINLSDTTSAQAEPGGAKDGFLAKFNSFDTEWFTYLGGSENDYISAIDLDTDSALFVVGTSFSDSSVVELQTDTIGGVLDTLNNMYAGSGDIFIAKYDLDGQKTWSNYFGGAGLDSARSASVYGVTAIFITGSTNSELDMTVAIGEEPQPHQSTYGGGSNDAHIMRWTTVKSTPPPNICDDPSGGGGGFGLGGGDGSMGYNPAAPLAVCVGDSITLTTSGGCLGIGAEWVWYADSCGGTDNFIGEGNSITVAPDTTSYYYVRAESIFEYSSCASKRVIVEYPITITASVIDSVCTGEPLFFSAEGALTYEWLGPDTITMSGQNPVIDSAYAYHTGEYIVNGMGLACTDSDTINAVVFSGPGFDYTITNPSCVGMMDGSIDMAPFDSTVVEFYWLDDSVSVDRDSLGQGIYSFYIENNLGCSFTPSVQLTDPPNPIDSLKFYPDTCQNGVGSAQLFLTDPEGIYTTVWYSFEDSSEIINPYALTEGMYMVSAISNLDCEFSESFSISNFGEFSVNILQDSIFLPVLETGQVDFTISPEQEDPAYEWSPIWGLDCSDCPDPVFNPGSSTTYILTVSSQLGCTASDSIFVEREIPPPTTFIANMFSPNGDGINDKLCIQGFRLTDVDLTIYDQSGESIFESQNMEKCWDGKINGREASGSFLYVFKAIDETGKFIEQTGSITIVR